MAGFVGWSAAPAPTPVSGRGAGRSCEVRRVPGAAVVRGTRARRMGVCVAAKKKKGMIQEDESNAFDVMAGIAAAASGQDLLAAALGHVDQEHTEGSAEPTASAGADDAKAAKKAAKKKKSKKAGILDDDANAVDVFAGIQSAEEGKDLLRDALGGHGEEKDEGHSSADAVQTQAKQQKNKAKKLKNKKGGSVIEDNSNAVDMISNVDDILGGGETTHVQTKRSVRGQQTEAENAQKAGTFSVSAVDSESETERDDDSDGNFVDDDEPVADLDEDAEQEFSSFVEEVEDFTFAGRRKKAKATVTAANQKASFGSGGEKFTQIQFVDVGMSFNGNDVLKSVTWDVKTGERVGLVGKNGCGKSTQLKMIAGELEPSSGAVVRSSDRTRMAVLRQEFVEELDNCRTLGEELLVGCSEEQAAVRAYEEAEQAVEMAGDDLEKMETLLNALEDARVRCDELDAWNLQPRIDRLLPGLGFNPDDLHKLVGAFSGGWKVRIGLGKVLLKNPDILLLDEPTNHLDLESVEWIENYLMQSELPMVIVSHDREFMDRLCNKIVEIEAGEAFSYKGNYSRFLALKKELRSAWERAYERQQEFIKEQTRFIKTNRRNPARSAQVRAREKVLERMERNEELVRQPPKQTKPLVFRFPPAPRSAREPVVLHDVTHGYNGRTLFRDANLALERGDKVAIVGPNGAGKSTLLRLIMGIEEPERGEVDCTKLVNAVVAYFEQNQADALDLDKTVIETVQAAAPADTRYEELRALLGKFLFKGDEVNNKVASLSGGEKARLALCKLMLQPANVLILDEPTNHLDIPAKEMLEEAVQHFDGTLVVVSHDRYFVSQVARQIVAVEDEELVLYDGDYKHYIEQNEKVRAMLEARVIRGVTDITKAPEVDIQAVAPPDEKKRKKNFGGSAVKSGKTKIMNAKRWSNL
ncbi:ABC transporter F family member 2 [Porphyridium purpureum]|uniref:Probable ATP-dependent transporter ycf16 n=1 Tax=Porphyridium purpureum TaxID=35688 RepID=A0A5J4Z322_PORPP|nr:ABC transporter F family member 2 [Porphyridium purpureum]|eukprot:POR8304..scf208_2